MSRTFSGPVTFLGSFTDALPEPSLPEIAFAGRSNAGKSSALNALLGSGVARVSRTPGRTQSINLFDVGGRWRAADLPGYGFAKVSHSMRADWAVHIERYLRERPALRLVIVLVDSRLDAQPADLAMLSWLEEARRPYCVLATKVDGLPRAKRKGALDKLAAGLNVPPEALIGFSSFEPIGREEVDRVVSTVLKILAKQG